MTMSAAPFHPGHLVMVDIPGTALDAATAEFLRRHHIRAICLFRRNLGSEDEIRRLTADLREVMGPNALIGIDQEGGSTIRATFLPQAPAAMALGAIGDAALCARYARALSAFGRDDVQVLPNTAPQGLWDLAAAAGLLT